MALWKPWASRVEEDHQPWVDFVLGRVKGRCWDRNWGSAEGPASVPATLQTTLGKQYPGLSLFTLQELWVENSRSLKKQLEMAENF